MQERQPIFNQAKIEKIQRHVDNLQILDKAFWRNTFYREGIGQTPRLNELMVRGKQRLGNLPS